MPISSAIRVRSGNCSVEVSPALGRALEGLLQSASGTVARELRDAAEGLAQNAERAWYSQVTKRTGLSGQLGTAVEFTETEVRVSIRSLDTRKAKNGKPVVYYVHRPYALSTRWQRLDRAEYAALLAEFRRTGRIPGGVDALLQDGRPVSAQRQVANPKASDGRFLVPELLTKPARLVVRRLASTLGAEISAAARRR